MAAADTRMLGIILAASGVFVVLSGMLIAFPIGESRFVAPVESIALRIGLGAGCALAGLAVYFRERLGF